MPGISSGRKGGGAPGGGVPGPTVGMCRHSRPERYRATSGEPQGAGRPADGEAPPPVPGPGASHPAGNAGPDRRPGRADAGPVVWVTGAGGRLGTILRRAWAGEALRPVWASRDPAVDSRAGAPPPEVILALAGVTAGPDMAANVTLAGQALDLGRATGARVLLASSAAVYGRAAGRLGEEAPLAPLTPYGRAKAEMEAAGRARGAAILRIGNVAGADALLGGLRPGRPVEIDRFADGLTPRRSYIGPRSLAVVLAALCRRAAGEGLPEVLNIAQPGVVEMAALARAAGVEPRFRPAPPEAIAVVELDVGRLAGLVPLAPARAERLVAEWRETA